MIGNRFRVSLLQLLVGIGVIAGFISLNRTVKEAPYAVQTFHAHGIVELRIGCPFVYTTSVHSVAAVDKTGVKAYSASAITTFNWLALFGNIGVCLLTVIAAMMFAPLLLARLSGNKRQ